MNKLALDLLYNEYFINKKSKLMLMKQYNIMSNTIYNFFKKNGISLRTLSESNQEAILQKRLNPGGNNQYKTGYHTSWDSKKIYYRSSYELNYAIHLDNLNVPYKVENLRIKYWDSQRNKYRIAIPDFYLPFKNKIVEIKGDYTYDKQNMIDKSLEYRKLGYDFELILEGISIKP